MLYTIPIELPDKMDMVNRRKLTRVINNILEFITVLLCIIYGLSKITYESLIYIERKLFNPFAFNLTKKYKEYENMMKIDFVNYNSIINIMNLAILFISDLQNHRESKSPIKSSCKIDEIIFIETLENYINLLYEDVEDIETRIERFISLHDNIIMILIGLLTILVTMYGLL